MKKIYKVAVTHTDNSIADEYLHKIQVCLASLYDKKICSNEIRDVANGVRDGRLPSCIFDTPKANRRIFRYVKHITGMDAPYHAELEKVLADMSDSVKNSYTTSVVITDEYEEKLCMSWGCLTSCQTVSKYDLPRGHPFKDIDDDEAPISNGCNARYASGVARDKNILMVYIARDNTPLTMKHRAILLTNDNFAQMERVYPDDRKSSEGFSLVKKAMCEAVIRYYKETSDKDWKYNHTEHIDLFRAESETFWKDSEHGGLKDVVLFYDKNKSLDEVKQQRAPWIGQNPHCLRCGAEFEEHWHDYAYYNDSPLCPYCGDYNTRKEVECDYCESYIDEDDDGLIIIDDVYYCCDSCAERAGYCYCDDVDVWCSKESSYYSDISDKWYYSSDNIVWSDTEETYIPSNETVWSDIENDFLWCNSSDTVYCYYTDDLEEPIDDYASVNGMVRPTTSDDGDVIYVAVDNAYYNSLYRMWLHERVDRPKFIFCETLRSILKYNVQNIEDAVYLKQYDRWYAKEDVFYPDPEYNPELMIPKTIEDTQKLKFCMMHRASIIDRNFLNAIIKEQCDDRSAA